jgi:hypothetical protein
MRAGPDTVECRIIQEGEKMKRNGSWKLVVVAASCWPIAAFAYIDPGTGSILIQGLIAAIAAIGVTLKLYWHRFVGLFRRKSDGSSGVERSAASSVEREASSPPSSRREQLRS